MPIQNAIEIHNLSFCFEKKPVLEGINLSFARGKFHTIIGPNGSGKTTLLRMLARALEVNKGMITVNGVDLKTLRPKNLARQLAVVPQDSTWEFDFSVLDVVLMGRTPYLSRFATEGEADLAAARQAMEMTDTWRLRERSIISLSGGERQRVLVARAIAQQTGIIILDEPVSHLDLHHQITLLKQVRELNRRKEITVLAVLHDLNLAAAFSDRLIVMAQGRVYCQGRPEEVLKPEIIRKVFGVEVAIIPNPETGRSYVLPKL